LTSGSPGRRRLGLKGFDRVGRRFGGAGGADDNGGGRAGGGGVGRRLTGVGRRARGRALIAASWIVCHLPEGPQTRVADLAGDAWYRFDADRAALARRNLARVCRTLAADGRASARVQAAATDARALERLVRSAFRHNARYYLEVARTPAIGPGDIEKRLIIETPDAVAGAFVAGRPVIFVGLHFGSLELPALLLASRVGGAVAPMETIDDAALQAWFIRTRGAAGIRIVGLREARRELLTALREGVSVGLVGDRDLTGGGLPVTLFGAPAMLPLGPAMLTVESGAPAYVVAVRRVGVGRYRGGVELIPAALDGSRRERVTATMTAMAAAFERAIATAPEQWWAVFFPIWPDLEAAVAGSRPEGGSGATGSPAPEHEGEPRAPEAAA
jgi:lauroyl/myristoyl acyltransferase